jgi:hypothetical protein
MLSPRQIDCPSDAEIELSAYNAAFYELGLRWHWDDLTYERLAAEPCERTRVRHYVTTMQPHLLTAYDADFLADAVVQAKQRRQQALAHCTARALPRGNWADPRWGEVGF